MQIEIIPPRAVAKRKLKVCAYCRVSSTHDDQQTSVENQIEYYESKINSNPEYEFAGIYCDRGISGTKEERPEFQRMLKDARLGKIDLVLTKSISRFARNTDTMLKTVRELQEYGIGIFFELQNMNTLDMEGELLLTIYAAFAQAESENTSELLRMAHLRRVKNKDMLEIKWDNMIEKGTPLEKIRAKQMKMYAELGRISNFRKDMMLAITEKVVLYYGNKKEFIFLDGTIMAE